MLQWTWVYAYSKIQISFPLDLYPIMKLLGLMVVVFNFRNPRTVFHNAFTNLHFHQQCIRLPFSATSSTYLFDDNLSNRCEWCSLVVLISISLIVSDDECIFMHLLFTCMSVFCCLFVVVFLRRVYPGPLTIFLIRFFF